MKFEFNWPISFWGKYVLICWWDSNISDFGWKVKTQPWLLKLTYSNCLIRFNISSENNDFGFNRIQNINFSKIIPFKCIRKQIWPWLKVGQGQPRIIVWTNLVGPTPQRYIPSPKVICLLVLEKKIFKLFLPYMGVAAILVMWPGPFWTNFCSAILRSLHMKFEFNWPSGFRGEDVWKCWRTDDGRTTDARVTGILLANPWAFGSCELKSMQITE